MHNPIDAAAAELADTFELLGDWEERYRYLIELGKALPALAPDERSEANKVRGCASQVWLISGRDANGELIFRGNSDAHIVKGLIAVLLGLYSGRQASDILAFDAKAAFDRLGLAEALSTQRSNGLAAMVARIRRDAERALQATP